VAGAATDTVPIDDSATFSAPARYPRGACGRARAPMVRREAPVRGRRRVASKSRT